MAPRFTSFRSMWAEITHKDEIENTVSPEKPLLPIRNPLSLRSRQAAPSSANSLPIAKPPIKSPPSKVNKPAPDDACKKSEDEGSLNVSLLASNPTDHSENAVHASALVESVIPVLRAPNTRKLVDEEGEGFRTSNEQDVPTCSRNDGAVGKVEKQLDSSVNSCPELRDRAANDEDFDVLESGMFRVLIFTDTHLGYKSSDPIRANDAFDTFEEALYLAKNLRVDAIFHAGDLFDESYPSRSVTYRTMDLLSRYCRIGETRKNAETLEIGFTSNTSLCEDEKRPFLLRTMNLRVPDERKIPFFVIHGNHDCPNGANDLSPIDLLDVANLVTYFGSASDLNRIDLHPFLLNKMGIRIALYGLGWVKDESLYKAFEDKRVTFHPPPNNEEYNWYNVLLFHQNRYPRNSKSCKDYIPEELLPDWLDLVIWGHEHECLRDPQPSMNRNFRVLQLGSTVQTSMAVAEMPHKHCCLMELTADKVDFYPITLETARQLHYSEVCLSQLDLPEDSEKAISNKLTDIIENILSGFKDREKTLLRASTITKIMQSGPRSKVIDTINSSIRLPLIRLRVEHSGFQSISPRTFGNAFKNRVANPTELLRFWQRRKQSSAQANKDAKGIQGGSADVNNHTVKQKVLSTLEDNCRLKIMLEKELNGAVERFASGLETNAISEFVRKTVSDAQNFLSATMAAHTGEQMNEDIYNQMIERSVLMRTQSGRMGACDGKIKCEGDNSRTMTLDPPFTLAPGYISPPKPEAAKDLVSSIEHIKDQGAKGLASLGMTFPMGSMTMNSTVIYDGASSDSNKRVSASVVPNGEKPKRSCVKDAMRVMEPQMPGSHNPLESFNIAKNITTCEYVTNVSVKGEPLKMSDFADDAMPTTNVNASRAADEHSCATDPNDLYQYIQECEKFAAPTSLGELHNGTENRSKAASLTTTMLGLRKPIIQEEATKGAAKKGKTNSLRDSLLNMFSKKT